MRHYIIDGNNLIGKISKLQKLQQQDKQSSREKLAFLIEDYFHNKKAKVTLHFDGYENNPIRLSFAKIIYSDNKTADDKIRKQIEDSKNRRNLVVVSSDLSIVDFARKCSCNVITSEEFARQMFTAGDDNAEEKLIDRLKNSEDWEKLFGVDE